MNQEIIKVAIIHGEKPVDNLNKDGVIDYLNCTLEDEYFHIVMMLKYLETHYKDNPKLQSYDVYNSINEISLYLSRLGNIIFLNTTNYRKEMLQKHGRHGIIMMPENITDNQKESLRELKQHLEKYNEIQIWYDIKDDNQAQMLFGSPDIIDEFIKNKTK